MVVALFVFLAVNLCCAVAKERGKHLSSRRPFTQERVSVFRPVSKWDNWVLWPQTDESPDCHVRGLTGTFCPANKALNFSFQKRKELRTCTVKWLKLVFWGRADCDGANHFNIVFSGFGSFDVFQKYWPILLWFFISKSPYCRECMSPENLCVEVSPWENSSRE